MEEKLGTGRRKRAVSSVRVRPGTGKFNVNKLPIEKYFSAEFQRKVILSPLEKFADLNSVDLIIRVNGGGIEAQAIATRLGIARALVSKDESLRGSLKALGYLTRDPRRKERKKYGFKKARKSFQFSKR